MAMFCHTCWNLLTCCSCDPLARPVHPAERSPDEHPNLPCRLPEPFDGDYDVVAWAEAITRVEADR